MLRINPFTYVQSFQTASFYTSNLNSLYFFITFTTSFNFLENILACIKEVQYKLFMTLPLDSTMESKCKCKCDNETKESCKVITLDKKAKILDKLWDGISAAAVGLTFCQFC
jgi:hypothetical protein